MEKQQILIIDDDPNIRKTLSDILRVKGYEPLNAKDGTEGLELLKQSSANLVIVDLGLPDMPGLEVLDRIKADRPSTEVIILTGNASLDSAIEATNKGAFLYLLKPYEIDQMMLHIRRAIEKHEAGVEIVRHTAELQKINVQLSEKNTELADEIAERKRAEDALRESEERFRSVVDNIGIGIALISPNMEILTLNNQMKRWFPYIDVSKKPVCYEAYNDPPGEAPCSYCPTIKTLQDGEVHESVTETPAGDETVNYRIVSSPIKDIDGNVIAAIEMVEDITDRERAQQALKKSEGKYQRFFMTSRDCVFITSKEGNWIDMNDAALGLFGYASREELMQVRIPNLYADLEERKRHVRFIAEHGYSMEYPVDLLKKDKTVMNTLITAVALHDAEGRVTGFQGTIRDITDRRRAEEALKRSEAYFRSIIENSSDIITILNEDGTVRYISPSLEHIAGLKPAEMTGRNIFEYVHPDDTSSAKDIFVRAIQDPGGTASTELRLLHSDSSWHIYEIAIRNLLDNEAVKGIVINSHDITDRKMAEEEKEKLIVELQESLVKIKALNGLLPICAWCKKIRDDAGYWQQLESYISTHSEAEFSHSICPECMKKKYPDIDIDDDDKEKD